VCGAHPLTFTTDDTLSAGNVSSHFIRFLETLKWIFDCCFSRWCRSSSATVNLFLLYILMTEINYSFMYFLLFRIRFLCLTFKMNQNALFIMTKITVPVCNTI